MRVHWLQHAEHEDLGCIAPWLAARGHKVTVTRLQRGELPPLPSAFDWLVVLGGPMNIYQHATYPWLVAEKQLIRRALDAGTRMLGICLGSQLIADQLGGPVTRNACSEIGWHAVTLSNDGKRAAAFSGFPDQFTAFQWHGDTFTLPPDAAALMRSNACANQAFTHGKRVVGIQFHLEVTAANARNWFSVERPAPARHVQTPEHVLAQLPSFADNNKLMIQLLANLEAAG